MMDVFAGKLKKKSVESFLWRVLGMICLFSMHVTLGKTLSPESYGLFSFTLSIVTILVLFVTMGWPMALAKLVPQYIVRQQWGLLKGVLLRSHQFSLGLAVVFSLLLIYLSVHFDNGKRTDAMYYASILLPIMSLIALRRRIFQGVHSVKGSVIPDEILIPSLVFLGLLFIERPSIDGVILIYFLTVSVVFILTLPWLWNVLPLQLRKTTSAFELKIWISLAFPLLLGGVSQMVLSQSGIFILGFFDDLHGAGLFSASFRVSLLVTFAMTAINVIGMPMLATAFHNKDANALKLVYKKTMFWCFFGALPPFIIFMLFPDVLISFFGNKFEKAAILLQILALGQLANAASGLSGSLLVVAGEEKFFAKSMTLTACCCIFLMFVCVPIWGELAAASVYSGSLALLSIGQFYQANKLSLK